MELLDRGLGYVAQYGISASEGDKGRLGEEEVELLKQPHVLSERDQHEPGHDPESQAQREHASCPLGLGSDGYARGRRRCGDAWPEGPTEHSDERRQEDNPRKRETKQEDRREGKQRHRHGVR